MGVVRGVAGDDVEVRVGREGETEVREETSWDGVRVERV